MLGIPKKGTYKVKEEIEKAPVHDHPCNLTETAVKISFPEIESEVFINPLGYKGSNMVYLQRCKGRCADRDGPVTCTATAIRQIFHKDFYHQQNTSLLIQILGPKGC